MDKKNLVLVLMVNVVVLIFAVFVFIDRYSKYITRQKFETEKVKYQKIEEKIPVEAKKEIAPISTEKVKTPEKEETPEFRNILFQYRSSKAKSVSIIGEFNNWTPQPLQRKDKNLWYITLKITPGKYAYNYLVDGKIILDPNNLKEPIKVRDFESSYLIVEPRRTK